jgi:hypothetical protein
MAVGAGGLLGDCCAACADGGVHRAAAAGWSVGALSAALSAYLYGNRLFGWLAPLAMLGLIIVLPLGNLAATVADMPRTVRLGVAIGMAIAAALTALVIAVADRAPNSLD